MNEFDLDEKLGDGNFGEVFKCRRRDGEMVAVKKISKSKVRFATMPHPSSS